MPDLFIFTCRFIYLPVNILQGLVGTFFLFRNLPFKKCIKMKWIPYGICSIFIFCAIFICNNLGFYEGTATILYFIILFLSSLIFCQGCTAKKLFIAMIPANAIVIGNIITSLLYKSLDAFTWDRWVKKLFLAVISIISLLIIFYIFRKITDIGSLHLNKNEWLLLGMNPALFTIAYVFISWSLSINQSSAAGFGYLSILAVILINFTMFFELSIFNHRNKIEMENTLLRQQIVYQSEWIGETKRQYDALQKTKHDFNNIISVIQYLNHDNKNREIDAFIRTYFDTQDKLMETIHTGNSCFDAIINIKASQAAKSSIQVLISSTAIQCNFENNMDLCNLIGNLFENAISASKESKRKTIYLDIQNNSNGLSICMKNTIDDSVLEKNPQLVTDKKDQTNHGYGIQIIKEIVKRHGGLIEFYEEDGCFCCNIIRLLNI